jgi:hypothetical protein
LKIGIAWSSLPAMNRVAACQKGSSAISGAIFAAVE